MAMARLTVPRDPMEGRRTPVTVTAAANGTSGVCRKSDNPASRCGTAGSGQAPGAPGRGTHHPVPAGPAAA